MAPNQSTETRQRQRRRRTCPATAIALVAALATTTSSSPFIAHANHPSSIKKTKKQPKKHPPKIRGGSWTDAAIPAQGVILGSSNNSSGGGGNGNNRVVIVQPDSLEPRSMQSLQSQSQSGLEQQHQQQGDAQLHPWPHPDTFQDGQQIQPQQQNSQVRGNSDWAGERATYGQNENAYGQQQGNVEYYQNGQPLQSSHSSSSTANDNNNNDSTSYKQWLQTHQNNGQAFQSSYSNNDDNPNTDYEEWLQAQSSAKAQSSAHVASYTQKQPQPRGQTQSHNGDSTSYEQWLQTQSQGQPRGQPLQLTYQEWLQSEHERLESKKQQQARAFPSKGQTQSQRQADGQIQAEQARGQPLQSSGQGQPTYQEWKQQQAQQAQGSAASSSINGQPLETRPKSKLSTPLEDLDVVSGKQVILRPRLNNDVVNSSSKQSILPPMGSASSSPSKTNDELNDDQQPVVYYYDPRTLQSSSSSSTNNNNNEMDAPELTLPEIVYTSSGHALKLEQVHAGGRNEVFLEVRPKAVWGSDFSKSGWNDRLTTLQEKLQFNSSNGDSGGDNESGNQSQSQDQLIVLFTVATMAVMVGALSAKRLRSKKLLESCMHPELDEDWEEDFNISVAGSGAGVAPRYDKKFDTDTGRSVASTSASPNGSGSTGLNSSGGFGALLGGRNKDRVRYYGTDNENAGMGGGGGLHWRGDMEKFDV